MAFVLLDFPKVHILSLWYNPVNFWRDNRQWVAWLSFLRTILKLTFSVRGTNPSTFGVMTGCGLRGCRSRQGLQSHGRPQHHGSRRPLPSRPFLSTRRPFSRHTEAPFCPLDGPLLSSFLVAGRFLSCHAQAPFFHVRSSPVNP